MKKGSDFILLKLQSKKNFIGQFHTFTLAIIQFSVCLKCLGYSPVVTVLCIYVVYTLGKKIQFYLFPVEIMFLVLYFLHSYLNDYCLYCSRRIILIYTSLYQPPSLKNSVPSRETYFRSPKASRKRAVVLCSWTVIRSVVLAPKINKYDIYIYRFIGAASFFQFNIS